MCFYLFRIEYCSIDIAASNSDYRLGSVLVVQIITIIKEPTSSKSINHESNKRKKIQNKDLETYHISILIQKAISRLKI